MIFTRTAAFTKLKNTTCWDVVVIGGGASGLGIAVDAASRGYNTLLLEKYDFAKGTSSKSTKLVHGGVRYLAQGDIKLVKSALKERGIIFQNAPHVSSLQSFVIPVYSFWAKLKFLIGLKVYDGLAGHLRIGKSTLLNKAQVIEAIPQIKQEGLQGGIRYFDGQFDDARLALNLAQTAVEQGAVVLNYAALSSIHKDQDGQVNGLTFQDSVAHETYRVNCKALINATGVFVDDVLKLDQPAHQPLVRPSQGIHLVVDAKFLGDRHALMIPETSDGRVLFGVPWHGKVLLGTTDTPLDKHQIEPHAQEEEIQFILSTAKDYLQVAPKRKDVRSVFAGLRPLAAPSKGDGKSSKEISREHKLLKSASGIITITGGKWTTYRRMAEECLDFTIGAGLLEQRRCKTKQLRIHGYTTHKQSGHTQIYGSDAQGIAELIDQNAALAAKLHPDYDFTHAELIWSCRQEMLVKVEDFLARRIRLLFLDARVSLSIAPLVAKIMAQELGKDEAWIQQELADYELLVKNYSL